MKKILSLVLLTTLTNACLKQEEQIEASEGYAESVESALNAIGGAADDASNQSMTAVQKNYWPSLLIDSAYAATCSRSLTHFGGGYCERNVNCEYGAYVWSGQITFQFSNASTCSLISNGESFTRTGNFKRSGPRGSLHTSTDDKLNYLGQTIGGGIEVTKVPGGYSVEILGTNKVLKHKSGKPIFDISIETSSPLEMTSLVRGSRQISDGTLVVYHNISQYTATHDFSDIEWSNSCCYPVSGTISSNFTGSFNGSANATFTGCGQISVSINGGDLITQQLANCE